MRTTSCPSSRRANGAIRERSGEVDREAVAVPEPGLGAEGDGAGPGEHAVDRDRERERVRDRRDPGRSARSSRTRAGARRPASARAAPGTRTAARAEPASRRDPARPPPPSTVTSTDQTLPNTADDERHPDPEEDVDEGRGEVDAARVLADQRAEPEEAEQATPRAPRRRPGARGRGARDCRPSGSGRPSAPRGEHGLPPEEGQGGERDDEHPRRPVEEDVARDREVANPPDPVGEEPGHLTVSSTIWSLRFSSSASKTPVIVAGKRIRAGAAGCRRPRCRS